jgi:hypothetical protein
MTSNCVSVWVSAWEKKCSESRGGEGGGGRVRCEGVLLTTRFCTKAIGTVFNRGSLVECLSCCNYADSLEQEKVNSQK